MFLHQIQINLVNSLPLMLELHKRLLKLNNMSLELLLFRAVLLVGFTQFGLNSSSLLFILFLDLSQILLHLSNLSLKLPLPIRNFDQAFLILELQLAILLLQPLHDLFQLPDPLTPIIPDHFDLLLLDQ